MTEWKKASALVSGDIVFTEAEDRPLLVATVGRGVIRGHLNIGFTDGSFSEVPPATVLMTKSKRGRS